jgi:hypothetical protein
VIPTDNRPFDDVRSQDVYFYGLSVGHWEGDTLVVKAIAFNDLTWLDKGGLFHSDKMTVTEKFTREGNALVHRCEAERSAARGAACAGANRARVLHCRGGLHRDRQRTK